MTCTVCGTSEAETVLTLPYPDAPNVRSYIVRCNKCGLRRLDPRPGLRIIHRYYGNDHNAYSGRRRGRLKQAAWELLRDASSMPTGSGRLQRVLRPIATPMAAWAFDINITLDNGRQPRVLEIGCGYGDLLLYLRSRGACVQGVDFDERAAARGQQYGLPIHVGDLANLELPDGSIDVAVLCHSLEHLPDPAGTIAQLGRLLRPGGRVHIAVPNGQAIGLTQEGVAWGHLSYPLHFWFFDSAALATLLERNGFVPVDLRYANTWRNHFHLWQSCVRSDGPVVVARRALRHCSRIAREPKAADVLRVVAVRRRGEAATILDSSATRSRPQQHGDTDERAPGSSTPTHAADHA